MNEIKKAVKEKLKKYSNREYLDSYIKDEFLTENGDANINLRLDDKYDLFDKKSMGNQLELNNDIYEYIDDKTSILDNNIQINLHLHGLKISSNEKGRVAQIIKEHYAIELYKTQKEYQYQKNKILILALMGIILLLLYAIIYVINHNFDFLLEVFGFLFSFALWQAFEIYMYDISELNHERECIAQKLLMVIEFVENK